ncbi:hypothetical protein [uncultured Algibacter sp.]|uniref:hypothetical protein n=1 Tax=uncultured Algibacter sp. TaxID=298659 RepID=UPI002603E06D|nr:hypothetical protein [uncultured Algibacter sp.]
MTTFGAQVAIVDDKPEEVYKIQENLESLHVGYNFFDATPANATYPEKPIETLDTIFLDLHYGEKTIKQFDPYQPAAWVNKLVSTNHKYFLVAWTLDTDDFFAVLKVLSELNKSPYAFFAAQKNQYTQEDSSYNIEKLFLDIQAVQNEIKTVDTIPGQIIHIEEDKVLIKCRISPDKPIFQVRRFDLELFDNKNLKPEINIFINIQITTEPGIRTIELFKTNDNLKGLFEVEDYFKDFNNSKFTGEDK